MTGASQSEGALAVALSDLRRVTEVGLEKVSGQVALVVQRLDQADQRADHFAERHDDAFRRIEILERNSVTHEQLNARSTRMYVILGLVVALLGPLATVAVSVFITRS